MCVHNKSILYSQTHPMPSSSAPIALQLFLWWVLCLFPSWCRRTDSPVTVSLTLTAGAIWVQIMSFHLHKMGFILLLLGVSSALMQGWINLFLAKSSKVMSLKLLWNLPVKSSLENAPHDHANNVSKRSLQWREWHKNFNSFLTTHSAVCPVCRSSRVIGSCASQWHIPLS